VLVVAVFYTEHIERLVNLLMPSKVAVITHSNASFITYAKLKNIGVNAKMGVAWGCF